MPVKGEIVSKLHYTQHMQLVYNVITTINKPYLKSGHSISGQTSLKSINEKLYNYSKTLEIITGLSISRMNIATVDWPDFPIGSDFHKQFHPFRNSETQYDSITT